MKKVYTHENPFILSNVKNIVEAAGIEVVLRNEFTAGATGDLSPFDTWVELWVIDERQYQKALDIIADAFEKNDMPSWQCEKCGESNEPSFDLCWKCQSSHNDLRD